MESYNYIESGLVLACKSTEQLNKLFALGREFSVHKIVVNFLIEYFDEYKNFPSQEQLLEKYESLDKEAKTLAFDYCLDEFKKQVVFRKIKGAIEQNKPVIQTNPQLAVGKLITDLSNIADFTDEDTQIYDSGDDSRLEIYQRRKKLRFTGLKLIGIPTPFKTINRLGIGWDRGELITFVAKTSVGKSWICLKCAAVAREHGFKTLILSAEMPKLQLYQRLDVIVGNMHGYSFSHKALRSGGEIDEQEYKKFLIETKDKKMIVCDQTDGSIFNLTNVISLVRKHKPDFLIIDAAEIVAIGMSEDAVWAKATALFQGLKVLCKTNNMACFVSIQANLGGGEDDLYRMPYLKDIAFGQAAIRSSDILFAMCKVMENEKRRYIQVQKFREGESIFGKIIMEWDVDTGLIREIKDEQVATDSF